MRLSCSWRFARCAPLLTTAVLICFGILLLCRAASGSEVSAAFSIAAAPLAEQAANGYGDPVDGDPLDVFAAEGEAGENLPKNAALLRTLVFVPFFGLTLGWLVVTCWRRRRPEVFSSIRCSFHSMVRLHQRRAVATLSGVFLL